METQMQTIQTESQCENAHFEGQFQNPAKVKRDLIRMLQNTIRHLRTVEINEPETIGLIARAFGWVVLSNEVSQCAPESFENERDYLHNLTDWNKWTNFDEGMLGCGGSDQGFWIAMGVPVGKFDEMVEAELEKNNAASDRLRAIFTATEIEFLAKSKKETKEDGSAD